ncbi:amidohydrolase family protein [Leptospira sp. 201903071]|uniref:amidohydrolase family protein n=1 Tax=Leptospira ainazelensis TaxID=2810034 RepID=UPI001966CE23|nr:amidohydrolase family protein [Leptospira ainazelensis]MBM9501963.1 amidohydrolase family protein [Leptospira ainazelensis]
MNLFDFNIHLPYVIDPDVNVVINQDLNLSSKELIVGLEKHVEQIRRANGINVLLFNPNLHLEDIAEFRKKIESYFSKYSLTSLVDFRRADIEEYMEKLIASGSKAIMFNSYLQEISESDFISVLKVCEIAQKSNLIICVDGSYGTARMFDFDNLKLACYVADRIRKTPIVIVHSGGKRILDAALLALSNSNVWLDTSFSLPFYIGSSVESDFAFAYKKIGCERIVFGSDNPYCSFDTSVKVHLEFFEKHRFSQGQIENILYNNSLNLFDL